MGLKNRDNALVGMLAGKRPESCLDFLRMMGIIINNPICVIIQAPAYPFEIIYSGDDVALRNIKKSREANGQKRVGLVFISWKNKIAFLENCFVCRLRAFGGDAKFFLNFRD